MKMRLVVEFEYDEEIIHDDDPVARQWFLSEVLGGDHLVLVDTGDVGDVLGKVRVLYTGDSDG